MKGILVAVIMFFLVMMNVRMLADGATYAKVADVFVQDVALGDVQTSVDSNNEVLVWDDLGTFKNRFAVALNNFKASSSYNELTLQQAIILIRAEMRVVDYIREARSGHSVYSARVDRDEKYYNAIPSVAFLHERLLDLATFEERLILNYQKGILKGRKNHNPRLAVQHRKDFLSRMGDTLEHYHDILRGLQYDVSINRAGNPAMVAQSGVSDDKSLSKEIGVSNFDSIATFCPVNL